MRCFDRGSDSLGKTPEFLPNSLPAGFSRAGRSTIAIMAAGRPVAQGLDGFNGKEFRRRVAESCDLGGGVLHWGR